MSSTLIACAPDIVGVLWAGQQAGITAVVGGQIHLDIPSATPPFPLLSVVPVGGFTDGGEALIENSGVTFNCWAKKGDRGTSSRLARAVITAAFNLSNEPQVVSVSPTDGFPAYRTTLHGATVGGMDWLPDPDAGYARYVVDVVFTTTTVAS